ncbi:MAG: hypothetical protein ABJD97_07930 [Betaproteobacteria bacterium]
MTRLVILRGVAGSALAKKGQPCGSRLLICSAQIESATLRVAPFDLLGAN